MRVDFTTAVCALLMLGLAVTQVAAQGFNVSKSETDVAEHGRNQMLGSIRLDYAASGGDIDDGRTIKVTYGNLRITSPTIDANDAASGATLQCGGSFGDGSCSSITATVANDMKTGVGTVTLNMGTEGRTAGAFVILKRIRADVSGLSAGDTITASINSSSAPTGFVPIGTERTESVGGEVSTVKAGLAVKLTQASRLLCKIGVQVDDKGTDDTSDDVRTPYGGVPAIKVAEGFPKAWETNEGTGIGDTHITVKMLNLPKGVSLRWPHVVNFVQDPADDGDEIWSTLTLTDASRRTSGIVNFGGGTDIGAGQEEVDGETVDAGVGDTVTYIYATTQDGIDGESGKSVTTEMDSFEIEFDVEIVELADVGTGGISDIWAYLAPAGKAGDDDRGTVLSYVMMPVTDPDSNEGNIINFTECVTYLLFPYVNCSANGDWTTNIVIANTTKDDGVFGLSDGAAEQSGSVVLHAFPRSVPTIDGTSGRLGEARVMEVTSNLAAGDTVSFNCSQGMLAGFEGHAIARAGFRHAHGMAFILTNFMDGASFDVAHGYLALVVPDPEFGGQRAPSSGESLGH